MTLRSVFIIFGLLLSACTAGGPIGSGVAPLQERSGVFYTSSEPKPQRLNERESVALAAAERSALEFGQPNVAYPWAVDASTGGSVRASEPFRIAGRDCRRLNYESSKGAGPVSQSQVTVCRRVGEEWVPVV